MAAGYAELVDTVLCFGVRGDFEITVVEHVDQPGTAG